MVQIQPEINFIKVRHFGDNDTIAEETSKLYKARKYNPFISVIPLVIQIFILIGVIDAIKNGINNPSISMQFLGIDLSIIPSDVKGIFILSPILAGVSSLVLSVTQNADNVLQAEQNKLSQYGMMILTVGLSVFLGWFVPVGVALYWIASNLLAILQMYILNAVINPKKYVDYEKLNESRIKLAEYKNINKNKKISLKDKEKERRDYKKFFSIINKHLVFYSEGKGFYKYYQGIIEYLLHNSKLTIHYITSDPEDSVFELENKYDKFKAYYIGEKKLITLMMKMDADVVVMTMPDLENFHIKRSLVRKDIEYIYIPHGMDSLNMTLRKASVDHYDTVFCIGDHIYDEVRQTEEYYHLNSKKLIKWGYSLLDQMIQEYSSNDISVKQRKSILIAPSWQEDNIVDSCLDEILNCLDGKDFDVIVRPHPQHIKLRRVYINQLQEKFIDSKTITIQTDFSSNNTVFEADILITDWSSIAYEYAFTTKKPVIFINTPMKVINPEYKNIAVVPFNILIRNEIGCSLNLDQLNELPNRINEMLVNREAYIDKINDIITEYIYNLGESSKVGGEYIINTIQNKINERKSQNEFQN